MISKYQTNKKTTTVTIDSNLLKKAKEYKVNLSKTLEESLLSLIKEKQKQNWLQKNAKAISSYNEQVDKNGIFSDTLRGF